MPIEQPTWEASAEEPTWDASSEEPTWSATQFESQDSAVAGRTFAPGSAEDVAGRRAMAGLAPSEVSGGVPATGMERAAQDYLRFGAVPSGEGGSQESALTTAFKPLFTLARTTTPEDVTRRAREFSRAAEVSPEAAQTESLATLPAGVDKPLTGTARGLVHLAEGFTSPIGLATLGMGSLPTEAQRAISLAFAGQMIKDSPEIARELGTEFGKPAAERDPERIAELITLGAGTAAMTAVAAKHGLTSTRAPAVPERVRLPGQPAEEGAPVPEFVPGEAIGPGGVLRAGTARAPEVAAPATPHNELHHGDEVVLGDGEKVTVIGADAQGNAVVMNDKGETDILPEKVVTPPVTAAAPQGGQNANQIESAIRGNEAESAGAVPPVATGKPGELPRPAGTGGTETAPVQQAAERIVAAAFRQGKSITTGPFHAAIEGGAGEPGFITDRGRFVNREKAFKIAQKAKQRISLSELAPRETPQSLFAEDLPDLLDFSPETEPTATTVPRTGSPSREEIGNRPGEIPLKARPGDASDVTRAEQPAQPSPAAIVPAAPEASKPKVARGITGAARFNREEELNGPDILSFIKQFGGMVSKSEARRSRGKEWWQANGSMYDDAAPMASPHHNVIYTGGRNYPDKIAQAAFEAGLLKAPDVPELWAEIRKASNARARVFQTARSQEATAKAEEAEHSAWEKATAAGKVEVATDELKRGDVLDVEGEKTTVVDVDPETMDVTVKDGRKFGVQKLPSGKKFYVEKFEPAPEETEFLPTAAAPRTAEASAPQFELSRPETVEEQSARLAVEQQQAAERDARLAAEERAATAKRTMLERLAAPIGGNLGSAGQAGLFGEPGQQEIFQQRPGGGRPQGMGAAALGELEGPNSGSPTSIKNAVVDVERARRGLPPAMEPARRSFGQVWDEAMARVDRNPELQDKLIEELSVKPRALTDVEDAMLLQRQIDLQNEYAGLTHSMKGWYDRGDMAGVEEGKVRLAGLSDRLLELYDINKRAGTETGRGLAARKMLANEDFTLANMEMELRAAKAGVPLSDAERAKIAELHDRIIATQKAFEDYQAKVEQERANRMTDEAIADMKRELAQRPNYDPRIVKIAEEIVGKLEKQADAARARLKERLGFTFTGIDPTIAYDLGVVGAAKIARLGLDFAKFGVEMVKEFGEGVRPYLQAAWDRANLHIDNEGAKYGDKAPQVKNLLRARDEGGRRENIIGGLKKAAAEGQPLELIGDYVRRLAEGFVRKGIDKREPLIDAVHNVLTKEAGMEISRRETMDAISGYGKFKPLNPDAIKAKLRDLKGQMQQVAKLQDIQARRPLQKTGVERRAPSDEERRLLQQVNEAKRRFGVVVSDPARQLRSALDAVKTRLRNSIADLEYQIRTKQKIVKTRTPAPFDAESRLLELRRDELKRQFDEIFPRQELTDEQRAQIATRALERSIADYEERIKAGDVASRTVRPAISNAQLDALRSRRDALQAEWEALRDAADPERGARAALAALKSRLANSTAMYKERLARGEFAPRRRNVVQLDPEAQKLKAENERAKQEFQNALVAERLRQRSFSEKAQDTFVRWRRGFLLSGPVTLAKLTAAAVQRMTITPMEEVAGAGYSKIFPGLAARAPREGGLNVNAEAKALTSAITDGMKDAWQVLKHGKGRLDFLYGKRQDVAIGEMSTADRSVVDYFGHSHGAVKSPPKWAEYTRSLRKRIAWNIKQGVDVTDPMVQIRLETEAYRDSQRTLFLQDNRVVAAYKRALTAFEQANKATGRPTAGGKFGATVMRTLLPIVRVPTNLVAETFQYAAGTVSGGARLALAYKRGIESLPPEEADLIMRHLKKGSLGAAAMLVGFLLPNAVGGYYQPGEKRNPEDVKAGRIRVAGVQVPSFLLHNPLLETVQLGATIRRVADSKIRKRDPEGRGVPAGLLAGALGLAEEVPFVRESLDVAKLFDPKERGQFTGELAKSIVVPQLVQWAASLTDKDAAGEPVVRKPGNVLESIESGIPVLRERVPMKSEIIDRRLQRKPYSTAPTAEREALRRAMSQEIQKSFSATNAPAR